MSDPVSLPLIIAAASAFTCTPVAVYDGDGPIWCRERHVKVRLAGIDAREMDGRCLPGHPCPAATGAAARDSLVRLIGREKGRRIKGGRVHILVAGPPLKCISLGSGKRDRTAAWCALPDGRDLSCAQLRTGTVAAWAYRGAIVCARIARRGRPR